MRDDSSVDWQALEKLLEWHIAQGTHGIVSVGTTGESATLNVNEHLDVIGRTIEIVSGRLPVIAGTGANATAEAVHLTQQAQTLGADASLLVTPYYNRPTQEGLYRHFSAIADACDLPQVLYNVPPRTGCDLLASTVGRLAPHANIIGIKEACGDVSRVAELKDQVPDDFIILSGEDAQTLRMMELGALGTISVTANVVPALMAQFTRLQPLHEILFVEASPQPTKWALHEMGMIGPGIRMPLIELSQTHRAELVARLKTIGALS
jgi:4-hydroxy-tetrahydrodipicolinate synthase